MEELKKMNKEEMIKNGDCIHIEITNSPNAENAVAEVKITTNSAETAAVTLIQLETIMEDIKENLKEVKEAYERLKKEKLEMEWTKTKAE